MYSNLQPLDHSIWTTIGISQEVTAENELALAFAGYGRYHKQKGDIVQAQEYLIKALKIFERLGTLIEPEKIKKELAELPKIWSCY